MSTHHRFRRVVSGLSTGGYAVDNSMVLNDGDSQYLNRTFSTPTNSSQFGYSFWVKLGAGYDNTYIISADGSGNNDNLYFDGGKITIQEGGATRLQTNQLLRDFHGWYNVVVSYDLGNASNDQKLRLYLNGSEVTSFGTDARSSLSSTSSRLNANGISHDIGANVNNGVSTHVNPFDGSLSEFVFLDGTVITPSMVGEFSDEGVWRPKDVTDSLSTNKSLSLVDRTSGTAIGDMTDSTAGNNLAAAFDGVFGGNDGANNATKRGSVSNAFVGKNWGTGVSKTITGFSTRDVNNAGYFDNTGEGRFLLYGSNSNPSSYNDGTLLYTGSTFTSAGHTTTQPLDFLDTANFNTSTAYQYHWIALVPTSTASDVRMAELIFYEDGGSFGNNGFYLPFTNSTGLGQDYSGSTAETKVQENTYAAGSEVNKTDMTNAGFTAGVKFTAVASAALPTVKIRASSTGFSSVTVRIETDGGSGNAPSGTLVDSNAEVTGITSSGAGLKTADFPNGGPVLTAGTLYWIVLANAGNWGWQHDVSGSGGALGIRDASGYQAGRGLGHEVYQLGNIFTPANSPTQSSDSPSNNHCVMSPLWAASTQTLSQGNLKVVGSTSNEGVGGTHTLFNGAYWEIKNTANGAGSGQRFGVASANRGIHHPVSGHGGGTTGNHTYHVWDQNNTIYQSNNAGAASAGTHSAWSSFTTGDVISFHVDGTNLKVRKNNDSFDTIISSFTATDWIPFIETYNGTVELRFQEDDWTQTLPTGAKAINTTNQNSANAPAIKDGSAYHQTSTWEGNITARKITQSGGNLPVTAFNSTFQPDWIWGKNRDNSGVSFRYFDSVRGEAKVLQTGGSSYTDAEAPDSNGVTDFEVDGFDIGTGVHLNGDGESIVAWQWAAGGEPTTDNIAGAGATPTAGSVKIDGSDLGSSLGGTIPVTRLSANRTSGFSIGTYTGSGSNGTIATGLTTKPDMLIIKKRGDDGGNNWVTYHSGLANQGTGYVDLGTDAIEGTLANMFNSVAPGSSDATLFNVGTNTSTNDTGGSDTYVFYAFHSVPGYSKFGTFVGNSSADGPHIFLGFSASWIMIKRINISTASWVVYDNGRDPYNAADKMLLPNSTAGDNVGNKIDWLSNGVKIRGTSTAYNSTSSNNYIYAAFASHPFASSTIATAR